MEAGESDKKMNQQRMKELRVLIRNIASERKELLKEQREYRVELNELG